MAYLYVRRNGRVEIREAHSTPRGPRSRTLTSFKGALTEDHLDRAKSASARSFDPDVIRRRALDLGIPIEPASADAEARALIARLRRGARLDPVLASILCDRLADTESAPVPDELADVTEWIGASDSERGDALRDVLRLYDTIARSRNAVREPRRCGYPRFDIRPDRRAS